MRAATNEEIKWCNRMRRLMKQKPQTIRLFCNGQMYALCALEVERVGRTGKGMPGPIEGLPFLGYADGGDF